MIDTKKLKDYLSKIAQLEAEKIELNRDIKQAYVDAEKDGIPAVKLKAAVKLSKMKSDERCAIEDMLYVVD